jgi:hypothetical protein
MSLIERTNATVGDERLSVTVTRRTTGDKIVSVHSSERWFATEQEATEALRQIMEAFVERFTGTSHIDAQAARGKANAARKKKRPGGKP